MSTQPHSHIPSERSTGKRLLFLNCSGMPVALHLQYPENSVWFIVLQGICAGLAFHLEVPSFVSCMSWPLCGPKVSCYGVAVTKKCHSCPSSPTSGLFYSLTVFSAAPWISWSSPLSHLPTSSGPVVASRSLYWKTCNSSVSPGYIKLRAWLTTVVRMVLSPPRSGQNFPRKSMRKECEFSREVWDHGRSVIFQPLRKVAFVL